MRLVKQGDYVAWVQEDTRMFSFPESALAHRLLDGKRGVEIGGSAHNQFGLNTWNVSNESATTKLFDQEQLRQAGQVLPVDLIAEGDELPFRDGTLDFVLTSHVLEHFYDPIRALKEWYRVVRPDGYVFCIVPHKERTFDNKRDRTLLKDLIYRYERGDYREFIEDEQHHTIWITEDMVGPGSGRILCESVKGKYYNPVALHNSVSEHAIRVTSPASL